MSQLKENKKLKEVEKQLENKKSQLTRAANEVNLDGNVLEKFGQALTLDVKKRAEPQKMMPSKMMDSGTFIPLN